jgi:hypothetical protein
MFYCIDYRNGGMGNTVLAHVLYACNQIDIDLENFFNQHSGNSHKIAQFNNTNLTARHLLEFPDQTAECVLEILCNDWDEVLRTKLSYIKWFNATPNLTDYQKFFQYKPADEKERLWQEFYQEFRDSSWPERCAFNQIIDLPAHIQKEILDNYQTPANSITSESQLIEWLCTTYYNIFVTSRQQQFANSKVVKLGKYLNCDFSTLISVSNQLGWEWNSDKSNSFFKKVLVVNQPYLDWLTSVKDCVFKIKHHQQITDNFELWEQAIIIAKFCQLYSVDLNRIKWNNIACSSNENNVYLTKFTRNYHGKTI